ncbi:hypothetical protein I546_6600 [Mycobacterium kansasii 732]|nr:hypothetical protein I546_6600 [Mycobacterium kansasii 732]
MIPTQSALRGYTVSHLTENAAHWRELAGRRRSVVGTIKSQADSLDWQGQGDEAMKAALARHATHAEQEAELLDTAAATAEDGAAVLHQQKHSIFATVERANVRVRGSPRAGRPPTRCMRRARWAGTPGSPRPLRDLRVQVTRFTGQEVQTATDVARSAGELGGEGAVRGHIQAVAAITTTHTPNPTVPPSPPAPSASSLLDALTGASPLIRHISPQAAGLSSGTNVASPTSGRRAGGHRAAGAAAARCRPPARLRRQRRSRGRHRRRLAVLAGCPAEFGDRRHGRPGQHGRGLDDGRHRDQRTGRGCRGNPANTRPAPPVVADCRTRSDAVCRSRASAARARTATPALHRSAADAIPARAPIPGRAGIAATPAPVTLDPGPAGTAPSATTPGTGNGGVHMLGFGPPGLASAPAAPSLPPPRDPTPPPMPVDPKDMSAEQAIAEWAKVNAEIRAWNARCGVENVGPLPPAQHNACIASRGPLLERLASGFHTEPECTDAIGALSVS